MDDQIVKSVLQGEHQAFRQIVEKYKKYVFAIIYNITRNPEETENLSQEAFIQAYSSLATYKNQGLKTWLGRIAVNKAIDWNRKKNKELTGQIKYQQVQKNLNETIHTIEDEVVRREEIKRLKDICSRIPHKYGNILHKYYIQSMNYKEIAEEEGISIRTVESRLYRAKKLLRDNWKEGG
ncbi:RNA polymerase sigma factor [Alkaliphilus peptidifermentans]|uniref:RNA polymerase sigma factor, sigma-70 family n=1 Tax=Alkaliphilus peptidifermentans DSM 18978 TaxID=1120976 RepID=A0A1G5GKA7_9FIRM|nr:RNA polymerase sigma factor [Alkaliphilus peptidifermentans]SCY51821.1 RNA polymerase sigma factor, sigma-70 family [Alkaliphilus peptidifermentans DSM 18978]